MFRTAAIFLILICGAAQAADFRSIRPIQKNQPVIQQSTPPANPAAGSQLVEAPDGAGFVPVDPAAVRIAFINLMERWNTPEFARAVENSLFDGSRLLEVLFQDVPRNATLRILNVSNVTTLDQSFVDDNGKILRASTVTLTANSQVEFVDANGAFQRRDGTNDFLIIVKTRD